MRLLCLLLLSLLLSACGSDVASRVHAGCMKQLDTELAKAEKAVADQNAAAQLVARTGVEAARKAGAAACDALRDACKGNADSAVCQAAAKTYN